MVNWYNRLYIRIFYEGGFSLADAPGGGMNARVLFRTAGDGVVPDLTGHRRLPRLERHRPRTGHFTT